MRIKYCIIEKLKNLTPSEMTLLLYVATKQDSKGKVVGVHNKDVCKNTGMKKASFYNALHGLERKGIISVTKSSDIDYDIIILDNDFSYEGSIHEGYVNLRREVFHSKKFKKLKAKEKYMLMYFLKITHENSGSYRIGVKYFYDKFSELFEVTERVIRSYLHTLREFFSVCIKNGMYYITYRAKVFGTFIKQSAKDIERASFVHAWLRRCKVSEYEDQAVMDTAKLIVQHGPEAHELGEDIYELLGKSICNAVYEVEKPKDRKLNAAYVHNKLLDILALLKKKQNKTTSANDMSELEKKLLASYLVVASNK